MVRTDTHTTPRSASRSTGFTLPEVLIVGALFAVVVMVGTLLLSFERARTRDAIRVADMTRVASAFALLYAGQASYAPAAEGCGSVGTPVSRCSLEDVIGDLSTLKDPSRYAYTISRVPDRENFAVQFRLERGVGRFSAGTHTLTKNGIQ